MKFWATLAFVCMLFFSSCSDGKDIENSLDNDAADGTIVLSVNLQEQVGLSRAAFSQISNGDFIDEFVFGIFEKNTSGGESTYTLVKEQYTVDMTKHTWPYELKLVVDPKKTYHIAFWAQKSKTGYYDTSDLCAVKVNYPETEADDSADDDSETSHIEYLSNNDELRDAFSGYCIVTNGVLDDITKRNNNTVILHRPFAQLRFGTVGWDYEGASKLEPDPVEITESQVVIKGLSQYYNAVEGLTLYHPQKYPLHNVTFSFNKLPAFFNVKELSKELKVTPYKEEIFIQKNIYTDPDFVEKYMKNLMAFDADHDGFLDYFDWNQYLAFSNASGVYADAFYLLNRDEYGQLTDFEKLDHRPTPDEWANEELASSSEILYMGYTPKSEIFKYLSMTYLLVPEAQSGSANGSVIDIELNFKGREVDAITQTLLPGTIETPPLSFKDVPVQRNWCTTILSDSFFVYFTGFRVYIDAVYSAGYNQSNSGLIDDNTWHGSDKDKPVINDDFNDSHGSDVY